MNTFAPLQYKSAKPTSSIRKHASISRPSYGFKLPTASSASELEAPLERQHAPGFSFAQIPIDPPVQTLRNTFEDQRGNNTGLPDKLKAGIERLSGMALDDVRVHYHSSKPAEVQALAYTQGANIHVGPGEEQHLAHEAWHVVQQKQGRVKPTLQARGMAMNNDRGLEREADVMGAKAISAPQEVVGSSSAVPHLHKHDSAGTPRQETAIHNQSGVVQRAAGRRRQPQRRAARRQWGDISMSGRRRTRRTVIPIHIRDRGNRLRALYRRHEGDVSGLRTNNYVYVGTSRGRGTYVGITNDPGSRQEGHGERFHLQVLNPNEPLSRIEVRGIEQHLINRGRRSTQNQNIANSIAAAHPYYPDAVAFGREFWDWIREQHGSDISFEGQ